MAALSGLMMHVSFARPDFAWLAWLAWIPLLSRILPTDPTGRCPAPFQFGFVAGLVFWITGIFWIHHVSDLGMVSLAVYLSLYLAAWASLLGRLLTRWPEPRGPNHLILALLGTASWVGLEWMRGWMLGGFPWNFAGVSQHQNLALIQIAEWTGVTGVSFVVVFFNLSLWLGWRRLKAENFSMKSWRYEFSVALFLVVLCLVVGMRKLLPPANPAASRPHQLVLALVQPSIPQEVKFEAMSRETQRSILRRLTLLVAATRPDLMVWPETALVDGPNYDPDSRAWLLDLAGQTRIPLLFGTLDAMSRDPGKSAGGKRRIRYFNAAMLLDSTGHFGPVYHKLHLVPFGEYIPFVRWIPWMRQLTPIPGSFTAGEKTVLFEVNGAKLGPLICFEDTLPGLSRDLVNQGADILLNLTNDAWFKDSPGAEMHARNAIFRAIETRRPLVRCTNHGLTCVIAPTGQIAVQLAPFHEGFLNASVSWDAHAPRTFYTRHGDWFPIACLLLGAAGFGATFRRVSRESC